MKKYIWAIVLLTCVTAQLLWLRLRRFEYGMFHRIPTKPHLFLTCEQCGRKTTYLKSEGGEFICNDCQEPRVPFSGDPSELTSPFKSDLE